MRWGVLKYGVTSISCLAQSLEPEGLVVAGQTVTVRDYDRLAAVAGPDLLLDGPEP